MSSLHTCLSAFATNSVERLELVGLHWCLVFVQVGQRVLCTVVVSIVVCIDGLGLQACNSVELLDRGSTQAGQCPEDSTLDLCDLCVLHCIDEGILRLCCMVLEFLGGVLLTERSDLVEVHLEVVSHLGGELILWCLLTVLVDLDERVVGSRQHCLCLLQSIDLTIAGLNTGFVVGQKPVALLMQITKGVDLAKDGLLGSGGLLSVLDQIGLEVCLGSSLVLDGLRVTGTLGSSIGGQGLVFRLCVLLLDLHLLHLLLHVGNQSVNHANHTGRLLGLLLILADIWCWARVNLCEALLVLGWVVKLVQTVH